VNAKAGGEGTTTPPARTAMCGSFGPRAARAGVRVKGNLTCVGLTCFFPHACRRRGIVVDREPTEGERHARRRGPPPHLTTPEPRAGSQPPLLPPDEASTRRKGPGGGTPGEGPRAARFPFHRPRARDRRAWRRLAADDELARHPVPTDLRRELSDEVLDAPTAVSERAAGPPAIAAEVAERGMRS